MFNYRRNDFVYLKSKVLYQMKKIGVFYLLLLIISACQTEIKNDDITIIDKSITTIIDKSSKIEIIADSLIVSEGPLWDENLKSLIENIIWKKFKLVN